MTGTDAPSGMGTVASATGAAATLRPFRAGRGLRRSPAPSSSMAGGGRGRRPPPSPPPGPCPAPIRPAQAPRRPSVLRSPGLRGTRSRGPPQAAGAAAPSPERFPHPLRWPVETEGEAFEAVKQMGLRDGRQRADASPRGQARVVLTRCLCSSATTSCFSCMPPWGGQAHLHRPRRQRLTPAGLPSNAGSPPGPAQYEACPTAISSGWSRAGRRVR